MTQKEYDKKVNDLRNNLVETEKQIQEIRKELDELDKTKIEPESRRWKPKEHDIYYYIDQSGGTCSDKWIGHAVDFCRYAIGNVFKTQEEAKFEVERLKVIAELKEFAEPDDAKWDEYHSHYYIYHDLKTVKVNASLILKDSVIHFDSKERAEEAIEAVGKDRIKKYYLRVKE